MPRLVHAGSPFAVEMPVHGSSIADLDMRRLEDYFVNILGEDAVSDWQRTLLNRELLIADQWRAEVCNCAYAGIVLFAREPRRRMPQAGIRLLMFPGTDMDYDATLDEVLDIPFVGLKERREKDFIEQSLPNRVLSYLQPHISKERLEGMQRRRHWDYPTEVIRELLVNAFAHRDWTRPTDVQLSVFADRLEVHSPGSLPKGVRNPNIVNILRDYDYMEHRGLGIRRKVIPLTRAHNGTDPEFDATEDYFKVTLRKQARPATTSDRCPVAAYGRVAVTFRDGRNHEVSIQEPRSDQGGRSRTRRPHNNRRPQQHRQNLPCVRPVRLPEEVGMVAGGGIVSGRTGFDFAPQ